MTRRQMLALVGGLLCGPAVLAEPSAAAQGHPPPAGARALVDDECLMVVSGGSAYVVRRGVRTELDVQYAPFAPRGFYELPKDNGTSSRAGARV